MSLIHNSNPDDFTVEIEKELKKNNVLLHTSSGQQVNWAFLVPILNMALKKIEGESGEERQEGGGGRGGGEGKQDQSRSRERERDRGDRETINRKRETGPAAAADDDYSDMEIQRKLRVNYVENFFRNPDEIDRELSKRMKTWHLVGLMDGMRLCFDILLFIFILILILVCRNVPTAPVAPSVPLLDENHFPDYFAHVNCVAFP